MMVYGELGRFSVDTEIANLLCFLANIVTCDSYKLSY